MKKRFSSRARSLSILLAAACVQSCTPSRTIGRMAGRDLLQAPELHAAQAGISIYDPTASAYLFNYQGDKYFIPASNTKLFTTYAGLKYLGDSLVGIRYQESDTALFLAPSGDPSLLHPAYVSQPVIDFLQHARKPVYLSDANWKDRPLGRGWAWDDYNDDYAAERSPLPVYGNTIRWVQEKQKTTATDETFESTPSFYSIPEVDWPVRFTTDSGSRSFSVQRERNANVFHITEGKEKYKAQDVPFITDGAASAAILLKDTVGRSIALVHRSFPKSALRIIHSRPVDSLFKPMLYHSDNFFAEQTLLMASNERLGIMSDARIIDTLLKTDLAGLPQRPFWVDGSGLSRNDLFTPQDFVWLLDKMSSEFGLVRMKALLPTGGAGTLSGYYKQDSGAIFAKTGTLSGVVALSGYLITQKNRLLIFSILVNNYTGTASAIRRKIEKFVQALRAKY
ncbi:MAG: D-alanyl-D-alanine carboxypeptidase [Bacteroidota bacterium]|nr:D-alanyl-D-alanine carboxypeptidase [Bacteroidota bacterium]MDP4215554.1 D-alanyl-D-alanine carboxypeptidase [Bacteroidota bacterium]MDP4258230.1 D-alanyl-D-alanine carboxypeptidase [Bacteroidota bacterium]